MRTAEIILPPSVFGVMSPYPTVVAVEIAHHSEFCSESCSNEAKINELRLK